MKKVTSQACSNVALLKYWGRNNDIIRLPANNSISINLSGLTTTTTLEESSKDSLTLDGQEQSGKASERVFEFLDLAVGQKRSKVKITSKNSFPASTGLSSSASGFAALAEATNGFYDLGLSEKEVSILARKGSGSASRSIPEGFVCWLTADKDEDSYSQTLYKKDYWDLRILAVVVSENVKAVPTSGGHETAHSSPYFKARMDIIEQREKTILKALEAKDFTKLGVAVEREMLEFHTILMTSFPPMICWYPETLEIVHRVQSWRSEGLEAYSTINTGHNVFVVTLPEHEEKLTTLLTQLPITQKVISNQVGDAAKQL